MKVARDLLLRDDVSLLTVTRSGGNRVAHRSALGSTRR